MVEVVTQIRAAEEQADELKKSARQQVRVMADEAAAEGKKLLESEREAAAAKVAEILERAQGEADIYLSGYRVASEEECAKLSAHAQAKLQRAAQQIVERIVEHI